MPVISITVVVEQHAISHTREIRADLSRRGMVVEDEAPEIGLIFGRGDASCLPELARAEGVAEARREDGVTLPPMDDELPQ